MAKKILSFEQYVQEADRSEEIEQDIVDRGEVEDLEDEVEETPEDIEVAEESDEETEETEEVEETKTVSEMLSEIYGESCKTEAVGYHNDDYEDHTLESYMKENAALVAALATKANEDAHSEVKGEEMTLEAFEAACESLKEAYCKKIDEAKEAWAAGRSPEDTVGEE